MVDVASKAEPLQASITGTSTLSSGGTAYIINVTSTDALKSRRGRFSWSVNRRYTEFLVLKEQLAAAGGGGARASNLRQFPGKFNSPFASREFIAVERATLLGSWLQAVVLSSNGSSTSAWDATAVAHVESFLGVLAGTVASPSAEVDESVEVVAAATHSLLISSGGDSSYTALPTKESVLEFVEQVSVKSAARHAAKGCAHVMGVVVLLTAVVVVGMLVFSFLEMGAENEQRANTTQYMLNHKAKYNVTDADFAQLLGAVGAPPIELDPESDGDTDRNWGPMNYNTLLFTFSVMTTIGYGSFAPVTAAGQCFLVIYAFFSIPVTASCLGYLASQLLSAIEALLVAEMDEVATAFASFDKDGSGQLSLQELRAALHTLHIDLSNREFKSVVAEVDDGSGDIDLREFKMLAAKLKIPIGRQRRTTVVLHCSIGATVIWLLFGSVMFSSLQPEWGLFESFYFCVVSLTTVGLGDYVPTSRGGVLFNCFYCCVGLGLMAIVLTAIRTFFDAVSQRTEIVAADAADCAFLAQETMTQTSAENVSKKVRQSAATVETLLSGSARHDDDSSSEKQAAVAEGEATGPSSTAVSQERESARRWQSGYTSETKNHRSP